MKSSPESKQLAKAKTGIILTSATKVRRTVLLYTMECQSILAREHRFDVAQPAQIISAAIDIFWKQRLIPHWARPCRVLWVVRDCVAEFIEGNRNVARAAGGRQRGLHGQRVQFNSEEIWRLRFGCGDSLRCRKH